MGLMYKNVQDLGNLKRRMPIFAYKIDYRTLNLYYIYLLFFIK